MLKTAPRIFIATVPTAAERLSRILADRALLVVRSFAQAQRALRRERFALAILGVYFDDSRMFDLIAYARGSALNRATPIVSVVDKRGGLSLAALRTLQATVADAQCELLNLVDIPDDRAGNALVLQRLERHLSRPAPAPPNPRLDPHQAR